MAKTEMMFAHVAMATMISLICFIVLSVAHHISAYASTENFDFTINSYVTQSLKRDFVLQQQKQQLKQAASYLIQAEDLSQSLLSIQPSYSLREQKFSYTAQSPVSNEDRSSKVDLSLDQKLPYGLSGRLTVAKFIETNNPELGYADRAVDFTLTQNLTNNLFGKQDELSIQSRTSALKKEQLTYLRKVQEQCETHISRFLTLYLHQERVPLFEELLASAQSVLTIVQRSYQRKLARKVDFLSAEADYLKVQELALKEKVLLQKAKHDFFASLGISDTDNAQTALNLHDPRPFFLEQEIVKPPAAWIEEKIQQLAVKQSQFEAQAAKLAAKDSAFVSVGAGAQKGTILTSQNLADYQEEYAKVAIGMDFNFFNVSRNENYAVKVYESEKQLAISQQIQQQQVSAFSKLHEAYKEILLNLDISAKRVDLYKQQIEEALKLLRASRIESEDYIRFRDQWLDERLRQPQLKVQKWLTQVQLQHFSQDLFPICNDGSQ